MEGRVFVCSWKKVGNRYRVWVKKRPKLAAEAETFQAADEKLYEVILRATDDGENTREYVPPFQHDAGGAPARIVWVAGNTVSHVKDPTGTLYAGVRCPRCGNSRGERTDAPLVLQEIESGYDGVVASIHEGRYAKGSRPVFSEQFIALLTPEERERFTWRKVERSRRAKKAYYEIVASTIDVPLVGVRGLRDQGGGRCETCGWFSLPFYNVSGGGPHHFVCSADLPDPVPSCFAAVEGRTSKLCFTIERWGELVGRPGARGLTSDDIGVLAPERCDREPDVPTLSQIDRMTAGAAALLGALIGRASRD